MPVTNKKELGDYGEKLVAEQLKKKGYRIITQNYRKRCGEIDLIARKKKTLAFVEVKMRTNSLFDTAEVITIKKQRRIINTAHCFLTENDYQDFILQFDIALVEKNNESYSITYLPNAFTSTR